MFSRISQYLNGAVAKGPMAGVSTFGSFTHAFKEVLSGANAETNAVRRGRNGFRTKELPRFAKYLVMVEGWGKYKVTQTKYPSHFSFRDCRTADMLNKQIAQEKRERKNKIRLANFAQYAKAPAETELKNQLRAANFATM